MKSLTALFLSWFVMSLTVAGLAADPAPSAPPVPASPLALLGFLTTHEWTAKLPDGPDGTKLSIHARFAWSENHHAIRISNQFIVNGTPTPYIDGLYVWNPQKGAIVFWYAGADGNLSEGTVKMSDGKLVHEFQEMHGDGKVESFVARVTPLADAAGWDNEILARKEGGLTPVANVRYVPDK
jgi:hypothetical protein